jgi:putative membrane protein
MERRIVLSGLAAVLTLPTIAALAQNQPRADNAAPGKAEQEHMERTMRTGSLALATSRIAASKATDRKVKQFAEMEVAEQETIAQILKALQNSADVTGSTNPPKVPDNEVRSHIDAKGQEMLKKLESAKAGDEFDKEYVRGQISGHKELLDAQEDYLGAGKVREHVFVAKLARGHIKDHIAFLQMIQSEVGNQKRG